MVSKTSRENTEIEIQRWCQRKWETERCDEASYCFCSFCRDKLQPQSKVPLRDLQLKSGTSSRPAPFASETPSLHSDPPAALTLPCLGVAEKSSSSAADSYDSLSLTNVTVPLESIKPSKFSDQNRGSWFVFSLNIVVVFLNILIPYI